MRAFLRSLPFLVSLIGLVFLAFVAGAVVVLTEIWPSVYLRNAWTGLQALTEQRRELAEGDRFVGGLAEPARTDAEGVTVNEAGRAWPGYTLYTSGHDQGAYLIDMDGKTVHEWHLGFRDVWNEGAAVKNPLPDSRIFYRTARVFPNGDLIALIEAVGDTPYGYGLVKMDKDGKPIWTYLQNVHHDFDVLPDGRIVTLTQEILQDEVKPGPEILKPPRLEDFVVILSADGKELQKVRVLEAIRNSPYKDMLHSLPFYLAGTGDVLHTNAVEYVTPEKAANFPFAEAGQILISIRELGMLAVLDMEKDAFTWATKGYWLGQHDPDILPNGHILLFDNNGPYGATHGSRVIEFDPSTYELSWSYGPPNPNQPLESVIRSSQQRLPNGDTLIEESNAGRLFEVTPGHEVVWEFINPVRGGKDPVRVPVIMLGERVPLDYFEPGVVDGQS
ncbi:MAG: hypothetical protein KDG89_16140 [Geminicoccaceae bacterium]|nr:hypothetical protein [Geminicoccaceae bacterium]